MSKFQPFIALPLVLGLSACLGSGSSGGGAGGGGAGGGGAALGPTTPALSASGSGTVAMRGLSSRFEKNAQVGGLPGGTTIYEQGNGGAFGFGGYNSFANHDATQSGAGVQATAAFANAGTAGATLNLLTAGTYVGGAAISDFNGSSATVGGAGRGQGVNQRYDQTPSGGAISPISSAAVALEDVDTDGAFDLALIDVQVEQINSTAQFEEVGIYYGGTFADQAAVDALRAANPAGLTFSRVAGTTPDDAALFSVSTLNGRASTTGEIYQGDIFVLVNFNLNSVTAEIDNVREADAGVGAAIQPFKFEIADAALSGTTITGGMIQVRSANTNSGLNMDTITTGAMDAAFMGANGDFVTGVFQGVGTTGTSADSIGTTLGVAPGTPIFINGRFTTD